MVIKLSGKSGKRITLFESSVISYGNQTMLSINNLFFSFESSVISYGNQTTSVFPITGTSFESSVISYGNQT